MANITITVQSLLNAATFDSYTISNTNTIAQLKTQIQTATSVSTAWFDCALNEQLLSESATLTSLGIVNGSVLRTHNKISRLATREDRQVAKLNLASLDRAVSGRPSTYDITELPTQYDGNDIQDNPNLGGLIEGRPWA